MTKTKKTALERLRDNAAEIHALEEKLEDRRNLRDALMAEARTEEGATWRSVAFASGLTEHGARKALISAGLISAGLIVKE